ncbi:MAG: TraR/DksA family transcriptional regulator [Nitrospirae bacterium]|nr:TraR/DksA family transcriptional regulator [Nitrospirota bacterium]
MPAKVKKKMRAKKTASVKKVSAKKSAKRPPSDTTRPSLGARSSGSRTEAASGDGKLSKVKQVRRREFLYRMLTTKRQEVLKEIGDVIGQSLTNDQQRRLESAMDVGDQALMDLEREMGISLLEMRNRKRQLIDEALSRLDEGTYGVCAECGVEISEKRLAAVPFAKLCVDCQSRQELLEKIEKEEERE